jgi:CRP/FNR family transcriptional regulator, cyclic AMP receptor protein
VRRTICEKAPATGTSVGHVSWPVGSLIAGIPEHTRQRLLSLGAKRQYAGSGQVLMREGDRGGAVYLILAGLVKVTAATDNGEALLAIRAAGDVVGELAVLDSSPRLATVTTAGPVIARVMGRGEFAGLLARDPDAALAVTRSVVAKLRTATARRVEFTGCDVGTRFARVLLELADRYGTQTSAGKVISCSLTQTELATLVGAAEPTIQRVLRQLKADGIVTTGYRETSVLDTDRLRRRAFPGLPLARTCGCTLP